MSALSARVAHPLAERQPVVVGADHPTVAQTARIPAAGAHTVNARGEDATVGAAAKAVARVAWLLVDGGGADSDAARPD